MKTYTPDQLVILDSGQIDQVQKQLTATLLAFLDDKKEELDFFKSRRTGTPERILYRHDGKIPPAVRSRRLRLCHAEQYRVPRIHLSNINLKDGSIETDR